MQRESVRQSNTSYRRGLVLGLTLAEVMLLLLFVLLLVLAGRLIEIQKELQERQKEEQKLSSQVNVYKEVIEELKTVMTSGGDVDDLFRELVKTKDKIEEFKRNSSLTEKKYLEVIEWLSERGVDASSSEILEEQLQEILENAELGKLVKNELGDQKEYKIDELLKSRSELEAKVKNQEGQIVNLRDEIKRQGGGEGYPPCWVSSSGKAEYIFNVVLTDVGMVVYDNKLPHRVDEQIKLPINEIVFEEEISSTRFMKFTRRIFEWSVREECRFYVKLFDGTGPTNKKEYKQHRKSVENRFYIKLSRAI